MTCCPIHLRRCSNIVNTETEQQLEAAIVQKYTVMMLAIYISLPYVMAISLLMSISRLAIGLSADACWQACCVQSVQLFVPRCLPCTCQDSALLVASHSLS